ncbi:hypothetical protein FKW44_011841, partial [Caligus rogercresseyi]
TARLGRRADKSKSAFDEESVSRPAFSGLKPKDLFSTEDSGPGRRRGVPGVWESESQGLKSSRPKTSSKSKSGFFDVDEEDDVIPIIPDLEDVQEEDLVAQVAEAPNVSVNRVASYKELDNDLLKHAAFATLDDIDLRALTKSMAPESSLKEPDSEWTWDTLFADIGGQLQEEWSLDAPENDGKTGAERPYTAFNKFPV